MSAPDYGEIAERIAAGNVQRFKDGPHIMALLGFETAEHGRLGVACRPIGESHWQSLPSFYSADDFDSWVLRRFGGRLNDAGRDSDGRHYVSYDHPDYGNEYGYSTRLGCALWAAFIRLVGKVGSDD